MTIEEIKEKLKKKATTFTTGGIRPTNELGESWIGKVSFKKENEELPIDKDGKEMGAFAMFFLDDLNYYPSVLKDKYMCAVFISYALLQPNDDPSKFFNVIMPQSDNDGYFCIRLYTKEDNLVPCDWKFFEDGKSFPLQPNKIENDYPARDDYSQDIKSEIQRYEDEEDLDYYDDIVGNNIIKHKIGGYPSYVEVYGESDSNEEFVLQIASDAKCGFSISQDGRLFFTYDDNDWHLYWDSY